MAHLTGAQRAVLEFYVRYQAENYLPPTIGEAAAALRVSRSAIHHHVVQLVRRGELAARSGPGRMTMYYWRPAA